MKLLNHTAQSQQISHDKSITSKRLQQLRLSSSSKHNQGHCHCHHKSWKCGRDMDYVRRATALDQHPKNGLDNVAAEVIVVLNKMEQLVGCRGSRRRDPNRSHEPSPRPHKRQRLALRGIRKSRRLRTLHDTRERSPALL